MQDAVADVEGLAVADPAPALRGTGIVEPMRSIMNQVVTTVALTAASSSGSRLPTWSTSSWLMNTQRMSSGSTRLKTSARYCSRFSEMPVSMITGSFARMTSEFSATETGAVPSPWWSWMREVSGAT